MYRSYKRPHEDGNYKIVASLVEPNAVEYEPDDGTDGDGVNECQPFKRRFV